MEVKWKALDILGGTIEVSSTGGVRALSDGWSVEEAFLSRRRRWRITGPMGMRSFTDQDLVWRAFGPDPIVCLRPQDAWIDGEEWRGCVGLEGRYCVSSLGRIRRVGIEDRNPILGRVLKPSFRLGYQRFTIRIDGRAIKVSGHTIVAEAFIGPCPHGYEVNHMNGMRGDNRACNLEYVTRKGNALHRIVVLGKKSSHKAKINRPIADEMRRLRSEGMTMKAIGLKYNVTAGTVHAVLRGRTWIDHDPEYHL